MLSVLGKGNFGQVVLARKKNGIKVAIKIIKKETIIENDDFERYYNI